MPIHLKNGNPIIAMVLMTLSTFRTSALVASFPSISLSFNSEEAAKKFVEDAKPGFQARFELNKVVVIPDYGGSQNAASAVYHAVNSYKDSLISVNEIGINPFSEEGKNLLKDIEEYIKQYFGSDAMTIQLASAPSTEGTPSSQGKDYSTSTNSINEAQEQILPLLVRVLAGAIPGIIEAVRGKDFPPSTAGMTTQAPITDEKFWTQVLSAAVGTMPSIIQAVQGKDFLPSTDKMTTKPPVAKVLGVAFQPYVGRWKGTPPNATTPQWNSYSQKDIVKMLEVIASKFTKISTYGMGRAGYYPPKTPWNQVDSNCHVAGAAAELNKLRGRVVIEVAQGIFQHSDAALQQAEIEAAFSAAKAANAVFPKTVTSFVFTNEYVVDAQTANAVNEMIVANKQKAHHLNIKVGVRSHTFENIANPSSPFHKELKTLIQNCDFIQCNLYPGSKTPTPQDGVKKVSEAFNKIKSAVAGINPQCEVMIGETGWPSRGVSFNNTDNNVNNLMAYYEAIDKWASQQGVITYLFEAIDEPWKSNPKAQDPPWQGANGAEGHYGLWYLNDSGGYTQKNGTPSPKDQHVSNLQVGQEIWIPKSTPSPPPSGNQIELEARFYSMEETKCHPPASGVHGVTLQAALAGQWQSKCQGQSVGRLQCAVDPKVIPQLTNFTLKLWDGRQIPAAALDIGTAIIGKKIDIFVDRVQEAIDLGVKSVTAIL